MTPKPLDLETLTRLLEAYDRDKRSLEGLEAWLRLNVAAYDALPDLISAITALQAKVEALTAERDAAIRELGSYAREVGEAKGREVGS